MPSAGSAPAPSAAGDAAEAARVAAAKAAEDEMERAAFLKIVRAMRGYAVDAAKTPGPSGGRGGHSERVL